MSGHIRICLRGKKTILLCCACLISLADWQWAPWARNLLQSGALEPRLLLLSLSNVGCHLLHHIPNKRILGSIVLPEISMVSVIHLLDSYATYCILVLFGIQYGEWESEVSLKGAGWMCIRMVVDCRRRLWRKVQRSTGVHDPLNNAYVLSFCYFGIWCAGE